MKKILFINIICICTQLVYSQSIVGIWQVKTSSVSSAYLDTYQFFPDSTFKFNTNQYDGLRRVLSIGGLYKVEAGKIIFTVNYTIEIIGGSLERSAISTGSDSWSIEGGKIEKIPLQVPFQQTAILAKGESESDIDVIYIDMMKYYKIDKDPNQFP